MESHRWSSVTTTTKLGFTAAATVSVPDDADGMDATACGASIAAITAQQTTRMSFPRFMTLPPASPPGVLPGRVRTFRRSRHGIVTASSNSVGGQGNGGLAVANGHAGGDRRRESGEG